MVDFLVIVISLTFIAITSNVLIRLFIIKPGQVVKIQHFIEDGHLEEGLIYVTMRLKEDPDDIILRYWQAELLWRNNKKEDSFRAFLAIPLDRMKGNPSSYATILFRLGLWYYENKDYTEAEHYFELLLETRIERSDFFYHAALLALEKNKPTQAVSLLNRSLKLDSSIQDALLLLGDVQNSLGAYQEAYTAYSRFIQLYPDNASVWLKLAHVSYQNGNVNKSLKFYNKAETFPDNEVRFLATSHTAKIYIENEDPYQGIQALSKAISYADPQFCSENQLLGLHYEVADLYISLDDMNSAINHWGNILKINKNFKDTAAKYAEFSKLRLSDFFKDMLTLSGERLVEMLITFIKTFGLGIDNYMVHKDGLVDIIGVEDNGKWRNSSKIKTLFVFWCSDETMQNSAFEDIKFRQNSYSAYRAVLITSVPMLTEQRQLLDRRSIDLFTPDNILSLGAFLRGEAKEEVPLEA